jgi:pyruvate/2-oxoglutarate/acetoin dehydrogenase E1 component/TPP-dependent pyruvate/acetoin dehydrogenase alpha subunit
MTQEPGFLDTVLADYRLAVISREASLLGRKEVLTGKAKFGIFGDGKELAQIAWAKVFRDGDFRSGYYRDQTFMLAIGQLSVRAFFSSLYADPSLDREPASGGRQMNGHFATRSLEEGGAWKSLVDQKNSSSDISPTAGQMPRLLGLAQASKVYRTLGVDNSFTRNGNEVAWGTIGNASTSEGLFWETINAAGVLQVPMVISVWDDEYGISVHARHQTTKESISEVLAGFASNEANAGYKILTVKGWDYAQLVATYEEAEKWAREEHCPVLVHVQECTQPQGHSTSGSHERYKTPERLAWEKEYDCLTQFRELILKSGFASDEQLLQIEKEAADWVKEEKKAAFEAYLAPIQSLRDEAVSHLEALDALDEAKALKSNREPLRRECLAPVRKVLATAHDSSAKQSAQHWVDRERQAGWEAYSSLLHSGSALDVQEVPAEFDATPNLADGRVILRDNFRAIFQKHPETLIFGEDSGTIGDVNQGLEGLQAEFGETRIADAGIREATILGQGIGMAMRGLRPIAEIQYLDYLLYALQIMSDDLATVQYRTKGGQKAPVIVRTRGHRLEGIWHSGSPMGTIIHSLRGMYVCVPRNMTQAAGFYNTLLQADEPALVVECLNGYRLKEEMPTNLGSFTVPLGKPEILRAGQDLTMVSYGSTLRIAAEACERLEKMGIDVELIDAQTLLPFDLDHKCGQSLEKTNRLLVLDEDVPGGASAYLLQHILEVQGGYRYLDASPRTLTAQAHRPAYGSDGDYFSKPSTEDVVELVLTMMEE